MKPSQGDRKKNQNKVVARGVWGRNGTDNKKGLGERAQSTYGKSQRNMYIFGLVFRIGSYYVTQAGLAMATSLTQPPMGWDYRYVLPYPLVHNI